jgi:hypothetical protein
VTQTFRLYDGRGSSFEIEADTADDLREKVLSAMDSLGWDYELAGVKKVKGHSRSDGEKDWYRRRCSHCGKFIAKAADSSTQYASADEYDEPEPEDLCQKCVDKEIEYYRKTQTMPCNWRHASYEKALAEELGFEWVELDRINHNGYWRKKSEVTNE